MYEDFDKRVAARAIRLPRAARIAFGISLLITVALPCLLLLIGFALQLFDRPHTLLTGRFQAGLTAVFLPATLLMATPLFIVQFLGRDTERWDVSQYSAVRFVSGFVFSAFVVLASAGFLKVLSHASAQISNSLLSPSIQVWSVNVVDIRISTARGTCRETLTVNDPIVPNHIVNLCNTDFAARSTIEIGDTLRITGRSGPFGITYSDVQVEGPLPVEN